MSPTRRHPVAHRLVDRVAQRARAAGHRPHLGAQQLHAEHVRPLPANVFLAHVDDALQAEVGTRGRGRHAVLPGAGLGNHPPLAHPHREQRLAERVVDLVGAGVVQVFALELNLRPAALLGQPLGKVQRRRPADKVLQQAVELSLKCSVAASRTHTPLPARRVPASASRARTARHSRQSGRVDRVPVKWRA